MSCNRDGRTSSASSYSATSTGVATSHFNRTSKRQKSGNALHDDSSALSCPVCFNICDEPYITKCGHTFCYNCIIGAIDANTTCPTCATHLATHDSIIPNCMLNDVIKRYKLRTDSALLSERDASVTELFSSTSVDGLRDFVTAESQRLTLPDVNVMLDILTQRKQLLVAESCVAQNRLLLEFLKHLYKQRKELQSRVAKELQVVEHDIDDVQAKLQEVHSNCPTLEDVERTIDNAVSASNDNVNVTAVKKEMLNLLNNINTVPPPPPPPPPPPAATTTTTTTTTNTPQQSHEYQSGFAASFALRRRQMYHHFDDFVDCYFASRAKDIYFSKVAGAAAESSTAAGLDEFRENLTKFSKYNSLRVLATLNYSNDLFTSSTIVSSIEFDKDSAFIAIAGVTKKIKVFDYNAVIKDTVDVHCPCIEMTSRSKISCVSWNSYQKSTLASSDYEGTVTIWDASTGQRTKTYQEHEKRCWSVDFNEIDSRLIASGSDDARVKLYSLNTENSIATLEAKANVCCVKFNPKSSCHLAFGSADHCVYYYDLRNMKEAVTVFKGHKKAVSYVKFLNNEEIVSASTDSQLKLWNITVPYCLRSFVGHVNEKNFIGLATDGDYIACGSENNAMYIYYKGLSKKLFNYKFDVVKGILEERRDDSINDFVSAVCWKQKSNIILAANSQGIINILELI